MRKTEAQDLSAIPRTTQLLSSWARIWGEVGPRNSYLFYYITIVCKMQPALSDIHISACVNPLTWILLCAYQTLPHPPQQLGTAAPSDSPSSPGVARTSSSCSHGPFHQRTHNSAASAWRDALRGPVPRHIPTAPDPQQAFHTCLLNEQLVTKQLCIPESLIYMPLS